LRGVICALLSSATWGWGPMCNVRTQMDPNNQ
jgi:hypothetical protein